MIGLLAALGAWRLKVLEYISSTRPIGFAGAAGQCVCTGTVLVAGAFWDHPLPEAAYYMKYVPNKIIWKKAGSWIDVVTLLLTIVCMWLPALYIRRIQPARVLQLLPWNQN